MKDIKNFYLVITLVFDLIVLLTVGMCLLFTGDAQLIIEPLRELLPYHFSPYAICRRLKRYKRALTRKRR